MGDFYATQTEVEVKGKKVKAWAVVDEAGEVKRAYTSKMIGDPQGGAEAYAAELNAMLPAPPKINFQDVEMGESFGTIEPHHLPEGFDPAASFLLGLNEANLFDCDDRCKGCGEIVAGRDFKAHRDEHRAVVSAKRQAGRTKSEPRKVVGIPIDWDSPEGIAKEMRSQGCSYREISEEFARRGIKTARGKDEWSTTAVMRLLK